MSVLKPRWLHPEMASSQAIAAAGGMWLVESSTDRSDAAAEARERGVRALEVFGDLAFLADLPELEFLVAHDPPDVAPIHNLPKLRLLNFPGTWDGRLDAAAWPALEWFDATEIPGNGGGVETFFDHPSLRSLSLARPRIVDLRPIDAPRLETLGIARTKTLVSLAGIEERASTLLNLSFDGLSALDSLRGIETLGRLEVLHLSGLRLVTSLEEVARLPSLRFLDIFDLNDVESLRPLAEHPTLEYVGFGRTADLDLEPLFSIPKLKLVLTGRRYPWNRDVHELPNLHDVPSDDPRRLEWDRLAVR